MSLLSLGGIDLEGFEIPASVAFGGAQRVTVHKLLGGGRVIDAMGRDDRALAWSGVFSGATAGDRAQTFDAMRAAGQVITLTWDSFGYEVVITMLDLQYCNPWWIKYRMECTVLVDLAQSIIPVFADLAGSVLSDLATASPIVDLSSVIGALSSPGVLAPGASGIAPAVLQIRTVQAAVMTDIATAEQGLDSQDVGVLVSSSGSMAQLCFAQGFIERSLANLQGALN